MRAIWLLLGVVLPASLRLSHRLRRASCIGAILAATLLPLSVGWAQEPNRRLSGVVVDTSRNALPFVNVQIGSQRTVTNDSGQFTIRLPGQSAKVLFRRMGYEPIDTVLAGTDPSARIEMHSVPVRLSRIEIVGTNMSRKLELRGFYDRMRDVDRGINRGYFITPEDLEARKPNFITQMIEGYPSIRVYSKYGQHMAQILGLGDCKMGVYLDGIRVIGKFRPAAEDAINMLVKPNEIAGAEVYPRGVSAPPQYQMMGCGVVLIWTK